MFEFLKFNFINFHLIYWWFCIEARLISIHPCKKLSLKNIFLVHRLALRVWLIIYNLQKYKYKTVKFCNQTWTVSFALLHINGYKKFDFLEVRGQTVRLGLSKAHCLFVTFHTTFYNIYVFHRILFHNVQYLKVWIIMKIGIWMLNHFCNQFTYFIKRYFAMWIMNFIVNSA